MKFLRFLFLAAFLVVVAAGGAAYYLLHRPYQGFSGERMLDIPKGTATLTIAKQLAANGVVQHDWLFLLARAVSPNARLQAGEYKFDKPASPLQVFSRIVRGDIFYFVLVVPEGQNMFDIAASVKKFGLYSEAQFIAAARDPSSIRDLDPLAPSLEGYLWPDTYHITKNMTPAQICAAMTRKFRENWKALGAAADVHNTVTLASLVEREARVPQDRPLVASVFRNRLHLGMKLDCDPTTVYAAILDHRYTGVIHRSDLDSQNPYNTYQNAGLPPGAIANPGLTSLKAAISPAETKYLYFVVDPNGSGAHHFSETLAQHSAAAGVYRRAQAGAAHPAGHASR